MGLAPVLSWGLLTFQDTRESSFFKPLLRADPRVIPQPPVTSEYIGKHGGCHHCEALAFTFIEGSGSFKVVQPKQRKDVRKLEDVHAYLDNVTLEDLLGQLKAKGITQKALAEQIGMNTRHLTAIKSSELRHHYFNELGATKLACLWVLEHMGKTKSK